MNGILIINKDQGMTSRDVVNEIVGKFDTKKVGHAGTLDPLATGVLMVGIGNGTKILSLLTESDKEYVCKFKLGMLTDTLDIEGNIISEEEINIDSNTIKNVINDFPKIYNQEVPIYSAVKVKGKKLYEYAREGKEVELPTREVQIKELEVLDVTENMVTIRTMVSKGTYIRSLINDIAKILNTNGTVMELKRTKQGDFSIENSISLDEVTLEDLKPLSEVFEDVTQVDEETKDKIKHGGLLPNIYNKGQINFMYNKELIAIYEVYKKDENLIKPKYVFIK